MNSTESASEDTTKNTEPLSSRNECAVIGIYGLKNKVNGKWYIGQSINIYHRWRRCYQNPRCKQQPKLYNALLKYGFDGFEAVVLEECLPSMLDSREVYWINYYNAISSGYNVMIGGDGTGTPLPDDVKAKISQRLTGRKLSPETRKKMSDYWKGRARGKYSIERVSKMQAGAAAFREDPENRAAMSARYLGRRLSDATKQRMSSVRCGRQSPVKGRIWVTDGVKSTLQSPESPIPENWRLGRATNRASNTAQSTRSTHHH